MSRTRSVNLKQTKGFLVIGILRRKLYLFHWLPLKNFLHDNDIMVDFMTCLFQSEEGLIPRICHVSFLVKVCI